MEVDLVVSQESHCFRAVGDNVQFDGHVGRAKGFLGQSDIARAVLDQEDLKDFAVGVDWAHRGHLFSLVRYGPQTFQISTEIVSPLSQS